MVKKVTKEKKKDSKKPEGFLSKVSYLAGLACARVMEFESKIDWDKVSQEAKEAFDDVKDAAKSLASDIKEGVLDFTKSMESGSKAVKSKKGAKHKHTAHDKKSKSKEEKE